MLWKQDVGKCWDIRLPLSSRLFSLCAFTIPHAKLMLSLAWDRGFHFSNPPHSALLDREGSVFFPLSLLRPYRTLLKALWSSRSSPIWLCFLSREHSLSLKTVHVTVQLNCYVRRDWVSNFPVKNRGVLGTLHPTMVQPVLLFRMSLIKPHFQKPLLL